MFALHSVDEDGSSLCRQAGGRQKSREHRHDVVGPHRQLLKKVVTHFRRGAIAARGRQLIARICFHDDFLFQGSDSQLDGDWTRILGPDGQKILKSLEPGHLNVQDVLGG